MDLVANITSIATLATLITSIATLVVLINQYFIQRKTILADHERRKKQATIEYSNSIRKSYRPLDKKLVDKFGEGNIINFGLIDDEAKQDIQELLSIVEHLAVGVNAEVYDLEILERMSGTYFIHMFNKLSPYIDSMRAAKRNEKLYCEFESMVNDVKKIRGKLNPAPRNGKIKHS